jgi:hypothetical protein
MVSIHRFLYENFHNVKLKRNQQINHIDLNRSNNSISNLEIVSHQQNQCHRLKQNNNTTGFKNIYNCQYKRNGYIDYYYKVQIIFNRKLYCWKLFNKKDSNALEKAIEYRDKVIKDLNEKYNTNYITDESFEILKLMNLYNIFSKS